MRSEIEIREALISHCSERGKQGEIAKLLDVHSSTVKRWLDGEGIPKVMLKVLAWVLFGEAPQRLKTPVDLQTTLEFEDDEWKTIEAMARREGTTPARFIAGRVRSYLAYRDSLLPPPSQLRIAEEPPEYGTPRKTGDAGE